MDSIQTGQQISPRNFVCLVEEGYDRIASRYLKWSTPSPARMTYLNKLLAHLHKSSKVLELGCRAGKPCTQVLAKSAQVIDVDISAAQVAFAKQLVPGTQLIHGDMMSLSFLSNTFDAVVVFYLIIHLLRSEQEVLIRRLFQWICPGGHFLANFGSTDDPGSIKPDWLGSEMYWSSYDVQTNKQMLIGTGFELVKAEVIEDDKDRRLVPFL
jgi:SAM-dependent methyltransferase